MDLELIALASELGECLTRLQKKLAVAESCTGGLIAATLTEVAGSSQWFDRGFVTYSNNAKTQMLNVQAQTLAGHGAVSKETALAMLAGALTNSEADFAIAVTGIAGPGGGTVLKPVGTVYLAWALKGRAHYCEQRVFQGDRHAVRIQTVKYALQYLLNCISEPM